MNIRVPDYKNLCRKFQEHICKTRLVLIT